MIKSIQLLIISLLFSISALAEQTLPERLTGPRVGAHQGGIFQLRPNTFKQFARAIRVGVDIIETDLRVTKDGVVMVFHDSTLDRATRNCKGRVENKTFKQIRKCRSWLNEKIPTFQELLEFIDGRVVINAEFKVIEVIPPALELLNQYQAHDWVYFQSKNQKQFELARSIDPNVYLLYRVRNDDHLNWALSFVDERMLLIEVDKWMLTPEYVDRIHAAGKLVTTNVWRLQKYAEFFKASCKHGWSLGVDVVTTNAPKRCVKQRKDIISAE